MSNETAAPLKSLKLHGMAQAWPELVAQARHNDFDPEQFMQMLLKAETAERQVRSINYQMAAARFRAHRDIAGFDFGQANVDEALVRDNPASRGRYTASGHFGARGERSLIQKFRKLPWIPTEAQ